MPSPVKAITIGILAVAVSGALLTAKPSNQHDASATSAEASDIAASEGCDRALAAPGVYDGSADIGGRDEPYRVVVPEGYAERAPVPLILWLAAGSGSLEPNFEWWSPYLGPAESVFAIATPSTALLVPPGLLDQLGAEYCIDTRRIHLMGQSSSAGTAARLACEASDRIASVFAAIATFRVGCMPERPVPLMAMTGDADRPAVTRSVEAWAEMYACDGEPTVDDLGSGVTRTSHQGCMADIVLYDVAGVGHGFIRGECVADRSDYCYQNDVFDQLREVERFFADHPLPG